MKHLARMIAFGGLIAAGMLAYAQQPQDNPQPQQKQGEPQTQPQIQAPADAPKQAPSAETVFAALDTDHDGKLSQEEFAKLFREAKISDVQEEFARWDKNGDNNLSMEEFKASYPKR